MLLCFKRIFFSILRWTVDNQFSLVMGAIFSGIIAYITIALPAFRKILRKMFLGSD